MATKNNSNPNSGLGVDSSGGPVVDPTANVLALVEAAVTRLNDMRQVDNKRLEDLRLADAKALQRLLDVEARRVNELLELRASYDEKLTIAESKRIDAIRAVDVAAVAVASERNAQQAQVLANQVATSAETLRALVATTTAATAEQFRQVTQQFADRLAALEKAQYENKGKSGVSEPIMEQYINEMKHLLRTQTQGEGRSSGITSTSNILVMSVGVLLTITMIVHTIITLVK